MSIEHLAKKEIYELLRTRDPYETESYYLTEEPKLDPYYENYDDLIFHEGNYQRCLIKVLLQNDNLSKKSLNDSLAIAVNFNDLNLTKLLLCFGADPNFTCCEYFEDYATLLGAACGNNNLELAEILVKVGADINADDGEPLDSAITNSHYRMVEFLIKHDVKYDTRKDPLFEASRIGNFEIFMLLINNGAQLKPETIKKFREFLEFKRSKNSNFKIEKYTKIINYLFIHNF